MALEIIDVTSEAEIRRCWDIRLDVFVGEQDVPIDEEIDDRDLDPTTRHFLAVADGVDVGTARMVMDNPGQVHIGRVAVRKEARRRGVGRALLEHAAARAKEFAHYGEVVIALSAQIQAIGFYESLGYQVISDEVYLDAGIEHKDMELRRKVS